MRESTLAAWPKAGASPARPQGSLSGPLRLGLLCITPKALPQGPPPPTDWCLAKVCPSLHCELLEGGSFGLFTATFSVHKAVLGAQLVFIGLIQL